MNKGFVQQICLLLMVAMLTSGISPACKFISGKTSFIEICSWDGSTKTVEVPATQDPTYSEDSAPTSHDSASDGCNFCFVQSHIALNGVDAASVQGRFFHHEQPIAKTSGLRRLYAHVFEARGPPAYFS